MTNRSTSAPIIPSRQTLPLRTCPALVSQDFFNNPPCLGLSLILHGHRIVLILSKRASAVSKDGRRKLRPSTGSGQAPSIRRLRRLLRVRVSGIGVACPERSRGAATLGEAEWRAVQKETDMGHARRGFDASDERASYTPPQGGSGSLLSHRLAMPFMGDAPSRAVGGCIRSKKGFLNNPWPEHRDVITFPLVRQLANTWKILYKKLRSLPLSRFSTGMT